MAHIDPLNRSDLPELADQFELTEQFMGFVPNSLLTMARVPGLPEAFGGLAGAVFMNGLIPPDLVQLVAMMVSTGGECRYCQAHTTHSAHRMGVPDDKLAEIWSFETSELYTDAERAALRLAFHAGQVPNAATAEDFAAAKQHFTEEQVAAIVAVCSLFGYLNRWNDTMATTLEEHPTGFADQVLAPQGWEAGKHG